MIVEFLEKIFGESLKPCKICGQPSKDVLVINGDKPREIYCRAHLMEEFSKLFRASPYKMAVFHPEPERKYCHTQYPYYPVDQMVDKFNFTKEDTDGVRKVLAQIAGECEQCHHTPATTGYYPKGILTWDGGGPALSKVTTAPKKLCTECTLREILADLTNNKESYVEIGLAVPSSGDGVYTSTMI